jgi:excisionase family DNA binding protein
MDMSDEILTTAQAAKLLGISIRTAQLWIEHGSLPSWKTPGGHRRVRRSDILALMNAVEPKESSNSAIITVIADQPNLERYREILMSSGEYLVDGYDNVYAAMRAIGADLPAALVVELTPTHDERFELLCHLATDPAFGHMMVIVISHLSRSAIDQRCTLNPRLEVLAGDRMSSELPARIRAILRKASSETAGDAIKLHYPFPILPNESQRVAAVVRTGLLDTAPEDAFDRLTWLASHFLTMPIALMTLLTQRRQWFKSRHGLQTTETPREWAFCNYTILQKKIFAVDDLSRDPRFANNPAVIDEPKFRFYAGAPLVDDKGYALGSLCVIDSKPRKLNQTQEQTLSALASIAADEIKLRTTTRELSWMRKQ